MSEHATRLPQTDMVTRLETDPRPAWLWPAEGGDAVWSNASAALLGARIRPTGLERAQAVTPIKGQIARIVRLGLMGRPTRSRMQFIAGRKPLSATCHCTPIRDENDQTFLLVVGVEPIAPDVLTAANATAEPHDAPAAPVPAPDLDTAPSAEEAREPVVDVAPDAPTESDADAASADAPEDVAPILDTPVRKLTALSDLVDKLAGHEHLFAPLDDTDDAPLEPTADPVPGRDFATIAYDQDVEAQADVNGSDWDGEDPLAHEEAAFVADHSADQGTGRAGLWQVTGRGLTRRQIESQDETPPADLADVPNSDEDGVEQTSRYNFEELSRILTDRVGREEQPEVAREPEADQRERATGSLVALSDESLVLNRLPIGILVFRDQEIVFVNRALVDLTGYENATTLRSLGLAAVFPTVDASEPAGPVTQLVRRDGEKVAVSARLNAITWQGRSAFMLSARANEIEPLRESEVKQFAALWAKTAGYDFFTADRAGVVTQFSPADLGARSPESGVSLTSLVARREGSALRQFLGLPARFAGGVRPAIALKGAQTGQVITLFAEGRAGIVTGYFGLMGAGMAAGRHAASKGSLPSAQVGRITRGLRRPLNTIAGFSELMASEAFGPLSNPRYLEYARDIRAAGAELGDLADELDDYVRLAEGELTLSPADIDIGTLLAECLVRVRGQAGRQRVLLRSAISERLPMVRADAATLKQAVLNMLASAISEAGEGAKVVLSGQREEDGAVTIHVRDAAKAPNALAERFVVFRDGVGADGSERIPSQSSIGLTLTRSLVAVNACSLSLDPASESGTLMTLTIPNSLVVG